MSSHRLEVAQKSTCDDPRGIAVEVRAREFLHLPIDRVRTRAVYKIAADLTPSEVERMRVALTDPITEESAVGQLPLPDCDWVIHIGFRPGVTDTVGRTAQVFLCDLLGRPLESWAVRPAVYTETLYLVWGHQLTRVRVEQLANDLLANTLIERITIRTAGEHRAAPIDLELPLAGSTCPPVTETIPLPEDADGLLALSRQRTLALSLDEMQAIRVHYGQHSVQRYRTTVGLPAHPTDIELEALAQTWSEHCKHKIFNARIRYSDPSGDSREIRSLFRTYIVEATRQIADRVDWLVSVFHDNAGVVRIGEDLHLVFKVETHNSPSALDPYGGAITGIVGVNRDPFGTGVGAALLTNTWGYCLGSPLYSELVPEGLLHPRRIRDGVHQGVIDGGNQSGIPYSRGFEVFDDRYLGKPLVFCGTVGVMPAEVGGAPSERKPVEAGDLVVMVGGRIGKDGIHGATFSSEALHQESPAQAVQIGDPITQKMMTDMLLEARDRGLYRALTDNGAGGLSSSVGEMARICGGAELDLDRAPLKYQGLMPWEILLSEAQERMTLAVPPEQLKALLELAEQREVEATQVGRFTSDGRFRLRYGGKTVGDLDLAFLHDGCPVMDLEACWDPPPGAATDQPGLALEDHDAQQILLDMVGGLNLCSKVDKCRQYDHEVKGLSVIKPLVGVRGDVPSDASVMRVRQGDNRAVLITDAIAPRLSDLDPGAMASYVVDLAVRRIVAAGGRLGQIAALDNFCWPDPVASDATPDGRHKLAGLVRCCEALFDSTRALDLPLISGKDSMKNDSVRGGVKISIPPTLLISAIGWIEDARRAIDLTVSGPGVLLYLLGTTGPELGGSEALSTVVRGHGGHQHGSSVPVSRPEACRSACRAMQAAVDAGIVDAAHAPHLGGLAAALATMCLASGHGAEVNLEAAPTHGAPSSRALLFAESPSRLLVAIPPAAAGAFEGICATHDVAWGRLGRVHAEPQLIVRHGDDTTLIQVDLAELRERYTETLRDL